MYMYNYKLNLSYINKCLNKLQLIILKRYKSINYGIYEKITTKTK